MQALKIIHLIWSRVSSLHSLKNIMQKGVRMALNENIIKGKWLKIIGDNYGQSSIK